MLTIGRSLWNKWSKQLIPKFTYFCSNPFTGWTKFQVCLCADEDGNLKVRTKDPFGRKFVFSFKSERGIAQLITRISVDNDGFQVLHGDFEEFDNQNNS